MLYLTNHQHIQSGPQPPPPPFNQQQHWQPPRQPPRQPPWQPLMLPLPPQQHPPHPSFARMLMVALPRSPVLPRPRSPPPPYRPTMAELILHSIFPRDDEIRRCSNPRLGIIEGGRRALMPLGGHVCGICHEEEEEEEEGAAAADVADVACAKIKLCGHVFHAECLRPWVFKGEFTCPLCRSSIF
jgi:hypothetical protein